MSLASSKDFELERRSNTRFPMELNVRYSVLSAGPRLTGIGRTLNVSSGGLLIASEQKLVSYGGRLEVSLDWPSRLNGATPLQLIATCRVIRCQPAGFAVRLERYQFRTRKRDIPDIPRIP